MRSVADLVRSQNALLVESMSLDERLQAALSLGEADLVVFQHAHGLDRETARRRLEQRRQTGRRRSGCIEALLS